MSDSIWKKDVSFKRKPKQEQEAVDVAAAEPVADEPKQSLLKKEISFKRKPKAEKAAEGREGAEGREAVVPEEGDLVLAQAQGRGRLGDAEGRRSSRS